MSASSPVRVIGSSARRATNGAGDGAGALLLAERGDDGGKVAFGELVDEVACGQAFGAHAHVERAVLGEGEAALSLIELH